MANVFVVHCIDTEGPLNESLEATFGRIRSVSGINLEPSLETLRKIQRKELDLGGKEDILAKVCSERLLSYNRDWHDLDAMLNRITTERFQRQYPDSKGDGWKYTWFIMDHIGYDSNPRSKIVGYLKFRKKTA